MKPDIDELYRRYSTSLVRYLRLLGCERNEAEDLTHDTFLKAMDRGFDARGERETLGWLRMVAKNEFLMRLRKHKRMVNTTYIEAAEEVWQDYEERQTRDAYARALNDCLAALAPKAKQAIRMRYHENRSREQMAKRLNMRPEGVKTTLRRAKDALRMCIESRLKS